MNCTAEDLAIARSVAGSMRKFIPRQVPIEDIRSCAYLALVRVLPGRDASKGPRKKYLAAHIRYGIIDQLRAEGDMHRVGRFVPDVRSLDEKFERYCGKYKPGFDPPDAAVEHFIAVDSEQEQNVMAGDVRKALARLPRRQVEVIRERFYLDNTLADSARNMQVHTSHVSHLQQDALAALRRQLAA